VLVRNRAGAGVIIEEECSLRCTSAQEWN